MTSPFVYIFAALSCLLMVVVFVLCAFVYKNKQKVNTILISSLIGLSVVAYSVGVAISGGGFNSSFSAVTLIVLILALYLIIAVESYKIIEFTTITKKRLVMFATYIFVYCVAVVLSITIIVG